MAIACIEFANTFAHCQIVGPGPKFCLGTRDRIIAIDDRCIERRHMGWVQEVQQVGNCWTKSLDATSVDGADRLEDLGFFVAAAAATMQETAKGALIARVLIDIWDTQFQFP